MPPHPHPTATATAAPRPRPRPRPALDGPPLEADSLLAAVDAGLQCLRNLADVDGVIKASDVEHRLRAALSTSHPDAHGHIAARVACAHLDAGDLTDAYFALLTARDQLLWQTPGMTGTSP